MAAARTPTDASFELPDDLADWERTQAKTFSKWANMYLSKRGMHLSSFGDDLVDGTKLINLIEIISNSSLGKYNKAPKSKIQMVENLQLPINFINAFLKEVKLQVTYSAENVFEKNYKLIMGMIFCLIHKFEIQDSGLDGKDGLLLWCQKNTKGYNGVDVVNFSNSWKDGLAFAALIHHFRPDLIDFASLKSSNALQNLNTAFDAAEKLGIARLLDAEDIAMAAKPDDKAVMTQLAHYWKILSKLAKGAVGKERVAAVLGRFKQNKEMATDYAERTRQLHEWIAAKTEEFKRAEFGTTVAEVQAKLAGLNDYHENDKPDKVKEKLACAALLRTLHAKQRVEHAPVFAPPAELTPDATEAMWQTLLTTENAYNEAAQKALAEARAREKEIRRLESRISKLQSWMTAKNQELTDAKLGDSRWETEGLLRMHEAAVQEVETNKSRADDVLTNGPKYAELADKVAAVEQGMAALNASVAARHNALNERLKKHIAEEELELEIAAKTEEVLAALDDAAEILEQPFTAYSEHDVALSRESLKEAEKRVEAQKAAVTSLVEKSASLGNRPNPFARNSTADLKARYEELEAKLAASKTALDGEQSGLHKLDELKKEFGVAAVEHDKWLTGILEALEKDGSGSLEDQVRVCLAAKRDLEAQATERLDKIRAIKEKLVAAGETVGETNPFTDLTLPALVTKTDSMLSAHQDKADVINGRIMAQKGMEITPAQMEELAQTFKFFDKHGRGGLDMTEFASCQESLGQELPEDQLKDVFAKHDSDHDGFISFNDFVTYMQTVMRVTDSYGDILEALRGISGDTISPAALKGILSADVGDYIVGVAPKAADGNIDVKELLAMVFDVSQQ